MRRGINIFFQLTCYLRIIDLQKSNMQASKVHLLKDFIHFLEGHSRIVLLGPLEIEKKTLRKTIKEISPTLIIFIDGGRKHKNKLTKSELNLTLSIGDGDSAPHSEKLNILLPKEKELSDLSFTLRGMEKSKNIWTKMALLGFCSLTNEKRLDHLLFNLGEVEKFVKKNQISIKMDERFFFFPPGKNSFKYHGTFSLIALMPTSVRISGMVYYQLKNWTKIEALSSKGLSNIASGIVQIDNKKTVIAYLAGSKTNS